MNMVLQKCLGRFATVYLDDILIYSKDEDEHEKHIRKVLGYLAEHGLYAKASKCSWFHPEIEYLGHIIDANGLSVDEKKIQAVASWPQLVDVAELRSFLGLTNYYRRFVKGYMHMTVLLTDLLHNNKVFI